MRLNYPHPFTPFRAGSIPSPFDGGRDRVLSSLPLDGGELERRWIFFENFLSPFLAQVGIT